MNLNPHVYQFVGIKLKLGFKINISSQQAKIVKFKAQMHKNMLLNILKESFLQSTNEVSINDILRQYQT